MTTPLLQQLAASSSPPSIRQPNPTPQQDTNYLPEVDVNQLVVWNTKRRKVCGYLSKKGGSTGGGFFGKGNRRNWKRRFFVLEHRIGERENYVLRYYVNPDDGKPKGELPLDGCEVLEERSASKTDQDYGFQLKVPGRREVFDITCTNEREKQMWIQTLVYVSGIASRRGMTMRQRIGTSYGLANPSGKNNEQFYVVEDDVIPPRKNMNANKGKKRPEIRLEVDIGTIPPGSAERARFVMSFQEDIGVALFGNNNSRYGQNGDWKSVIKVYSITPANGMDWLTIVSFDILVLTPAEKTGVLQKLENLIVNTNSDLYMGIVTCQLDSTYISILTNIDIMDINNNNHTSIATPIPRVKELLERYMHIVLPADAYDSSKFHVYIRFEGKTKTLWLPSPRTLPRKSCVLWPYEVKDCLGLTGTVQDIWMTPIALTPVGVPDNLEIATQLVFEESSKHGDMEVIDTCQMRQGVTYDVVFEDRRMEAIDMLNSEQKADIVASFERFDGNGDGSIDREECLQACKERTDLSKEAIDLQFDHALESVTSQTELDTLNAQKLEHYQKIEEAEAQLLSMFERADLDGDGVLSQQEFFLAEAWWMRSTLNTSRIALF